MSSEHVLIPKERYEKLLARMTQKSSVQSTEAQKQATTVAETASETMHESQAGPAGQQETPNRENGASDEGDKVEVTRAKMTDNTKREKTEDAKPVSPSRERRAASSPPPPEGPGRTLEEIQANHADFLPPGEAVDKGREGVRSTVTTRSARKKSVPNTVVSGKNSNGGEKLSIKSSSSRRNTKSNDTRPVLKRKAKPFTALSRKWVKV